MEHSKNKKLQIFVEKILEKNISEQEIKEEMEQLDMIYTEDPLVRLNRILQKLHPSHTTPGQEKTRESKI